LTKEKYHHGTLKEDMIDKGLLLLNKEGFEGFSLRKVAIMCGVSHTAPYKHFKDKDTLINEIALKVIESFKSSLMTATINCSDDPRAQIIEMGKCYVKFMVENPEYLKFLFLTEHTSPIVVEDNKFLCHINSPFNVFKESAEFYLSSMNLDKDMYTLNILTMWSLVHGIAVLIANKALDYKGDYLELVHKMIDENLKM